jgi:WS/DGAT/MGAT family acyltransferase
MHQLTPAETALLAAETNTNLGHQSLCLEVGPRADGAPLSLARLRAVLDENLHLAPSLRRRIRTVPLELDDPWWIEDPYFDLDYHVRHLAVPGASDPDALEQLLARLHERPLDRNRPLWELYLIENPDGATTIFVKVHVVLLEELGPLGPLSPVLIRPDVDLDEPRRRTWTPDMLPTDADLLIKAMWSIVRSPLRTTRHLLEVSQRVPVVGEVARLVNAASARSRHPIERARNDSPVPRLSLNQRVGAHRRVALVSLPLEPIRRIHHERGVRFHDVLLSVFSGALRHWLVLNDELPVDPVVALTPLLVNADEDLLGAALVPIATQRHDPLQRLADINASMSELTLEIDPEPVRRIAGRRGAPTVLAGLASRLLLTTGASMRMMPPFNVYVVSVPGHDEGDIDGHPIVREHVMCPIVDGTGLSVCAISGVDRVDVTLVADRDLVTDLEVIAESLPVELERLVQVSDVDVPA